MPTRRRFLRDLGAGVAGWALAEAILSDPYAPLPAWAGAPAEAPRRFVSVRGKVTVGGRPRAGVAVSDGVAVVRTGDDGVYELVADASRPFVFVSVPSGCKIPVGPSGTARFHRPIAADAGGGMDAAFELEPLPGPDREHALFLLADPQTQSTDDVSRMHAESVPDVAAEAKRISVPLFGVACGDIAWDRLETFPEFERAVSAIGIPCFQLAGNHDVETGARTDEASTRTFERFFGPTYYSFDRGEIHYVVLDDVFWHGHDYIGYLDQRQLDWLAADLAAIERGRRVVVCTHIPPLCTNDLRGGHKTPRPSVTVVNRELLYEILAPYHATILSGHLHESDFLDDGGCDIHVCGAVCGGWWTGPVCYDGTPSGYMVYEMSGTELRWRYKSTGKPADHQMRLYAPAESGLHGGRMLANVWAATPKWTIDWYENGERRGRMTPVRAKDPLAVQLYAGPVRPHGRGWVDPVNADHLVAAAPSARAREIVVEAKDPWGRIYRERLDLARPATPTGTL